MATAKTIQNPQGCPACGHKRAIETETVQVYHCAKCGAIYGTCYLGDSYGFVSPWMAKEQVPAERLRYFDFTTLGSQGVGRRHGWYDPSTRLVHQVG